MTTHINHNDTKKSFEDLFKPRSEEKEIEHDSLMLMAAFLSEIEFIQEQNNISRKELAKKIKTSGSYLTQVFRSKKPLNFLTLAKIKRALNLGFEVKAFEKNNQNSLIGLTYSNYRPIEPKNIRLYISKEEENILLNGGTAFVNQGEAVSVTL